MIKVGIVGARGFSALTGLRARPDVEITAFCDLNEDLLKAKSQEHNIKHTYRVFEDMLEADIDAVWIASPMQCHVPQAIAALEAGKHVMSEVVAGISIDELWWLIEAVECSGKIYMFAENTCYYPYVQQVREMVRKGLFGELYYAECSYIHDITDIIVYPNGKRSWRYYWQLGTHGAFYPTHSLGPVMQWFEDDRIASIAAFGSGHHVRPDLRNEDTTLVMCRLESGKLVNLRVDCLSPRPVPSTVYFQLQGTKGVFETLRGCGDVNKIWFKGMEQPEDANGRMYRPLSDFTDYLPDRFKNASEDQKSSTHGGSDFFIVDDFINAINTNTQPECNVYKACEWTSVGLLSALSVTNNGREIEIPNFRKNMPREEQFIKL
ncbi:MAG: Gfo/Idh/MocA family oxidoreductase [Clostridiales bacterium]|jgi:predicted dehydrogenase|nr:Gfo/Idh/MocA family oxidoreductase [Clostridiales bacterium]